MHKISKIIIALVMAVVAVGTATAATARDEAAPHVGLYHWQHGTPVGFSLSDLQHQVLSPGSVQSIDAKLYEAKAIGANTIRLQIMQDHLVGKDGNSFDYEYMGYVQQVTSYGLSLGLTMVLNAQTEKAPGFNANEGMPTHATHVFWQQLVSVYGNVHGVQFDLFNEPRHCTPTDWQHKMQSLVWMIRKHASNPIWLEGCKYASTLAGLPHIKGRHLIYTYHHPGAPWPGMAANDAGTWDRAFGNLSWQRSPVVNAEMVNDQSTYHLPRKTLQAYLRYAKAHHIGMLVFGLEQKGLLKRYLAA